MNLFNLSASALLSSGKKHQNYALFTMALLLTGLIAILQIQAFRTVSENTKWVIHTHEVILKSNALLSLLQDAETGQRGYLLTGKASYLEPYESALKQIRLTYQTLLALTRDNSIQQHRLLQIDRMMRGKLAELDSTIQLQLTQGLPAALQIVQRDRGKQLMDSLRVELSALQRLENQLLIQRNNQFESSRQQSIWWQLTSVFLSLALLLAAFFSLHKRLKQKRELTHTLAKKVDERTYDLQATTEELAASNEELAASNEEISAANEDLAAVNQQLLIVNTDLDNFVYAASHDLKAPVANMQGLLTLLMKRLADRLDQKEREILVQLTTSVNRLRDVIQDLTEIIKVQKQIDSQVQEISLPALLTDVLEDLANEIQEADAQIITHFELNSLLYVHKYMRSILFNLVSNAIKYRSPERRVEVRISTHLSHGEAVLTVADNGLGLSETHQAKLFTMFKRFHTHVEGSGIGLYMIKRIVENNGGHIKVTSTLGQGTTFLVYLKT